MSVKVLRFREDMRGQVVISMYGWNGKVLRVNLSKGAVGVEEYGIDFALKYMGGRGFAAKILFEELKPGIDPLGPENKLIVAAGPLTGLPGPSLGKLVVAAKS
ncbi:MAG: aldehyde ferredoxin oxidoreductase N-terminal domain-containing protein, partial [Candidatus Bathyarchaeia archaeon]